jgi:folate-binding protein YgfZ
VVKVAGDDARRFLNGLVTGDMAKVAPGKPCFAALLTPQGKIIADFIIAEARPRTAAAFSSTARGARPTLVEKLNFYKLRAKVICEDLSEVLGVMAVWADRRQRVRPELPGSAAAGARLARHVAAASGGRCRRRSRRRASPMRRYENHRIALGVPRGGLDFVYGDTFPHEADMDQLNGVDFDKGCYVGQEVVSRWSTAPAPAAASCRSLTTSSRRRSGCRSWPAKSRSAHWARRRKAGPCDYAARPDRGCFGCEHDAGSGWHRVRR